MKKFAIASAAAILFALPTAAHAEQVKVPGTTEKCIELMGNFAKIATERKLTKENAAPLEAKAENMHQLCQQHKFDEAKTVYDEIIKAIFSGK